MRLGDNLAHPGFHNGAITRIHGLDLGPTQIDADDIAAPVGQTGSCYRANISQAEYTNGRIHAFGQISSKLKLGMRVRDWTARPNAVPLESAMTSTNSLFLAISQVNNVRRER